MNDRAGTSTRGSTPRGAGSPAPGTIRYGGGVVALNFGGDSRVGNRFDIHPDGVDVTASGTVDTIVAVVVPGPALTTGSADSTTDTVTFIGIGASDTGNSVSVLFGEFASSYLRAMGSVTTNMQGHHRILGSTGGMGPTITGTFDSCASLNDLIRTTGNILPVERVDSGADRPVLADHRWHAGPTRTQLEPGTPARAVARTESGGQPRAPTGSGERIIRIDRPEGVGYICSLLKWSMETNRFRTESALTCRRTSRPSESRRGSHPC